MQRLVECLVLKQDDSVLENDIERVKQASKYLKLDENNKKAVDKPHTEELCQAMLVLFEYVSNIKSKSDGSCEASLSEGMRSAMKFLANSSELNMSETRGWYVPMMNTLIPEHYMDGQMPSLLGSKMDHMWCLLDALSSLNSVTQHSRYYDGYHLLAAINDLRVENKDTRPDVPCKAIDKILDLYVNGIQGIIAQLAWCIHLSGEDTLSETISPPTIEIRPPEHFKRPTIEELSRVMRVVANENEWAVFTLGIPGEGTAKKLCCHVKNGVKKLR